MQKLSFACLSAPISLFSALTMKLSEKDREVLYAIRLDADVSLAKVARLLGCRIHTVRYCVRKLFEYKIVSRFALMKLSSLGFTEYDIACGLSLYDSQTRKQFFSELKKSHNINFIAETSGSRHCLFTLCARSPSEVDGYLKNLTQKFGEVLSQPIISACVGFTIYAPKYLSKRKPPYASVHIPVSINTKITEITDLDRKILSALARHGDLINSDLARTLGVPLTTLTYRLSFLRKSGIYHGHLLSIRPQEFGFEEFRIHLAVKGLSIKLHQRISQFAAMHKNVTLLIAWLGPYQYSFGITCQNADDGGAVVNDIYDAFGSSVTSLELLPVIREHKIEYFPFES